MTDTDPRLEAVAKAHRETELPATLSWDQREARRFIAVHDALRAFDQAQPTADRERIIRDIQREAVRQELNAQPQPESEALYPEGHCRDCPTWDHCGRFGCIKEAHIDRAQLQRVRRPDGSYGFPDVNKPQPESEVMPHSDLSETAERSAHNATAPVMGADPPWLEGAVDEVCKCNVTRGTAYRIVRTVLTFANAQPPSEKEIDNAWCEAGLVGSPTTRNGIARILIAAAKARSGA